MKHLLLISCLILCSCFSEEENLEPCSFSSRDGEPDKPVQFEPCPSVSAESDPLILECPPEDIAECPISEPNPYPCPLAPDEKPLDGWTGFKLTLSVKELPFNKQGMVRCVTASNMTLSLYVDIEKEPDCRTENIIVSDSINNPPRFIGVTRFKRLICPWFTATMLNDRRTFHILAKQNETGKEREMRIFVSIGNTGNAFTITQSAE